jgi:hypothetical protein
MRGAAQKGQCGMIILIRKLETINMPITQRCNYAGPLAQHIPTRSFAAILIERLRGALEHLRR